MGGMIAQALVVRHSGQVRRPVLCATQPGTGRALVPPAALARTTVIGSPAVVLATLFRADQRAAEQTLRRRHPQLPRAAANIGATKVAQFKAIVGWLKGSDRDGARVQAAAAATLVADGRADALDPVANDRQLAALVPHAQLVLYPDAGHAFLFQDEKTFVPRVETFLR